MFTLGGRRRFVCADGICRSSFSVPWKDHLTLVIRPDSVLGVGLEKPESREECCKRPSSGHEVADTHKNSQHLCLLAHDL